MLLPKLVFLFHFTSSVLCLYLPVQVSLVPLRLFLVKKIYISASLLLSDLSFHLSTCASRSPLSLSSPPPPSQAPPLFLAQTLPRTPSKLDTITEKHIPPGI
ncbi:hypothetical protein BDQ17DRAFT_1350655 [Cyathus striatus]|nr:hypothetical protein BDQ17DRAFT_1350655 [Cyathus striatus]